nr:polymer-forming cytoskeletal protein [Gluconacetobacter dulcium]
MFSRKKPKPEDAKPPVGASSSTGRPAGSQIEFPAPPAGATPVRQGATPATGTPSLPQSPKETAPMSRAPLPSNPPAPPGAPPIPGRPGLSGQTPAPRKDHSDRRTLVVGRGISVQGSIQDAERLVVEGTVESTMINAHELQVAHGGMFRGEIEVEDADLAGTIDGTLTVRGSLTIRSSGRLLGKAKCRRLQVEDGGQVSGHLEMITGAQPAAQPVEAPAPTPAAEETPAG